MAALGKNGKPYSLGFSALLGFHRLAEAVALAVHLENVAAMAKSVQERCCHSLALEDLAPFAERKIARHQDAAALVAIGEDPEQQLHPAPTHRHVAQLVADQQVRPVELGQKAVQRELLLFLLQPTHQFGRREETDSQACATGSKAQSNRDMSLPSSVVPRWRPRRIERSP